MPQHLGGFFRYHIRRPAVTLTFDLQNLIRLIVGAREHSLSILSKLFKPFMRYHDNYLTGQTNGTA